MGNDKTPAMILKIQAMRAAMSKSELLVCDYIIQHPDEVIYLSVSELAAKSGVSDATVVRTSQKIGSRSYQDLKISLAQDIVTPLQGINEEINVSDSPAAVTEKVFQGVIHTLNFTYRIQDPAQLDRAADILLRAGRICICGLGNSHAIAADIQHKLMRLGLNANAYSDNHLQVICSTFLKEGDALFADERRPLAPGRHIDSRTAHGLKRDQIQARCLVLAHRADGTGGRALHHDRPEEAGDHRRFLQNRKRAQRGEVLSVCRAQKWRRSRIYLPGCRLVRLAFAPD